MSKASTIWLITDTHFNHSNIIKYCYRPENFEEKIKNNLLRLVKEDDVLLHLGDICIGKDKDCSGWFKENLKCRTWLIKGNHDNQSVNWYLHNGWDFVGYRLYFKYSGKFILFSHCPIDIDKDVNVNIHGHQHIIERYDDEFKEIKTSKHKLLSLEYSDYKPIELGYFLRDDFKYENLYYK